MTVSSPKSDQPRKESGNQLPHSKLMGKVEVRGCAFTTSESSLKFTVLIFLPLSFCLPASVLQEEGDRKRAAEK